MAIATAATRAELITLAIACDKVVEMLREVEGGSGKPTAPGRYTSEQIDTQITALEAAIAAVKA